MSRFIAEADRELLASHGLDCFEALWQLPLEPVDESNTGRGGQSTVYRLTVGDQHYFLKRQSNYLTRSWRYPLGEPTFRREFRTIELYQRLEIPTLEPVFYGERRVGSEWRSMLMTRALDEWEDFASFLARWLQVSELNRKAILLAVAELARTLHQSGQIHGCFYPKHIFLRREGEGFTARVIDLEKSRASLLGRRDHVHDLEPLLRRASVLSEAEIGYFVKAYLQQDDGPVVTRWLHDVSARTRDKKGRE